MSDFIRAEDGSLIDSGAPKVVRVSTPTAHDLDNQSWLRRADLDALRTALASGETVPLTASSTLKPVLWVELASVLASYNAFTRLWNRHETDPALPLSPEWWDGTVGPARRGRVVTFRVRAGTLRVSVSSPWSFFYEGWSFQKQEIPIAGVRWAGWVSRAEVTP